MECIVTCLLIVCRVGTVVFVELKVSSCARGLVHSSVGDE